MAAQLDMLNQLTLTLVELGRVPEGTSLPEPSDYDGEPGESARVYAHTEGLLVEVVENPAANTIQYILTLIPDDRLLIACALISR